MWYSLQNIGNKITVVNVCNFAGGRQAPDIINWLKKKTGPPALTLETVDDAKTFIDKDEVVIIGFFKVRHLSLFVYCILRQ